jgi:hypothetical protein
MTIPPKNRPPTKSIDSQELELYFDSNGLADKLDSLRPAEVDYGPVPKSLGYPKGSVSFAYLYTDEDGNDFALVAVFRSPKGEYCGGRKYHPIALLIDGIWCHTIR